MQSTFSIPDGSVSGWTPAMQLQPVVQPAHTLHATQIQRTAQPNPTQVMVVHPSNQVQYQLHMSQAGWTNPQFNTAQMTMARQTWKSDKKEQNDGGWCLWQQERVRLQQQYQLLHSEYNAALVQIQNLTVQQEELGKKLKMEQWKYQELNNKYFIDMQTEQNKYDVLNNMHNETCIQLRDEKGKCNALSIKLEESSKNLKNEQQKYILLSRIHAETKKILHSLRQKRDEVVNDIDSKNKSIIDKDQYEAVSPILSRAQSVKSNEPCSEHVPAGLHRSHSSTRDLMQAAGANAFSERINHLVVPPGFERRIRVSGQGVGKVE